MHKKQLPKQFHYIFPSFSDVPAVIQACLLLYLSTATWNLIRYVTVVIRFASLIFIMLLPFPIYLQNRERNAMFNLNTGKSATVILILLHTQCCILYCFLYYIILPKWSKVSPASLFLQFNLRISLIQDKLSVVRKRVVSKLSPLASHLVSLC